MFRKYVRLIVIWCVSFTMLLVGAIIDDANPNKHSGVVGVLVSTGVVLAFFSIIFFPFIVDDE